MSYKKNKEKPDTKVMPHLFFDMPSNWGVALLALNKKGKIVTEWWARNVDDVSAAETFGRWRNKGHAAFLTLNGVIMAWAENEPIRSFKCSEDEGF